MLLDHFVHEWFNPHPKLLSVLARVSCVYGHLRILPNYKVEEKVFIERLPRKLISTQKILY